MKMDKVISLTIIGVSIVISIGIFISRFEPKENLVITDYEENLEIESNIITISPIDSHDHMLGNPNARIIVVEFTHLECSATRDFHQIMRRIIREYGPSGDVAWVIRHLPVPDLFENSELGAIASECVALYGRENNRPEIFWEYINALFSNIDLDISRNSLRETAINLGVDENFYNRCIVNNPSRNKILQDIRDAEQLIRTDSQFMTPYNLIITNTGLQTRISGSLDYFSMRNVIEEILEIIQ